jgi:hypothetical protein
LQAELAELRTQLKRINRESASRRKQLEEFEAAEAERKKAEMSEVEKAQAAAAEAQRERDEALQKAQDLLIQSAFVAAASKAGVAHPDDVYRLADLSAVEIDDAGKVDGVEDEVKRLVEAGRLGMSGRPQAPSLDGGAGRGVRPSEAPPALTPEELAIAQKMSLKPEEYMQYKSMSAK